MQGLSNAGWKIGVNRSCQELCHQWSSQIFYFFFFFSSPQLKLLCWKRCSRCRVILLGALLCWSAHWATASAVRVTALIPSVPLEPLRSGSFSASAAVFKPPPHSSDFLLEETQEATFDLPLLRLACLGFFLFFLKPSCFFSNLFS